MDEEMIDMNGVQNGTEEPQQPNYIYFSKYGSVAKKTSSKGNNYVQVTYKSQDRETKKDIWNNVPVFDKLQAEKLASFLAEAIRTLPAPKPNQPMNN